MGLDMYLSRTKRIDGLTLKQMEVYYGFYL